MAYYDNINLEKGMYAVAGKSFSEVLEEMDPSNRYQGTAMQHLDAFERQLKRFDIKVSGSNSDMVEKFYSTATSASLFPEYVKRIVIQGVDADKMMNRLVAAKTTVNSMDYRSITSIDQDTDMNFVGEGQPLPETIITTQDKLVKLQKQGRMLRSSYEAIRFQRLDLFGVTLRQIGNRIAKAQLHYAMDTLIHGDGNDNPAQQIKLLDKQFTYKDLLNLWNCFDQHEMTTLIAHPTAMMEIMNLDEFKNPHSGLVVDQDGGIHTPLGATIFKSIQVPEGVIVALDHHSALEFVTAGEVMIEHDKLIDRQIEQASISSIFGFSKIFTEATKMINIMA